MVNVPWCHDCDGPDHYGPCEKDKDYEKAKEDQAKERSSQKSVHVIRIFPEDSSS